MGRARLLAEDVGRDDLGRAGAALVGVARVGARVGARAGVAVAALRGDAVLGDGALAERQRRELRVFELEPPGTRVRDHGLAEHVSPERALAEREPLVRR